MMDLGVVCADLSGGAGSKYDTFSSKADRYVATAKTDGHTCELLVPGVTDADVRITWEPAWNQSMISEEGKMKLGLI